jgi:cell division transport system permease protein
MMHALMYIARIIKTGFKNFFRNGWLSLAATTVMLLTLFTISLFTIINLGVNQAIATIKDKIDVSVYLNDGVTPAQLSQMKQQVLQLNEVQSVSYISKTQALKIYQQQNAGDAKVLSAISAQDNPLPASLEVKGKNPDKLDELLTYINRPDVKPLVHNYSYKGKNENTIKHLVSITNFVQKVGLGLSSIFAVTSLLVIFNTIRIAIFTRKEEIGIMKLVGATSNFIRWPYLIEGAMYGIFATIISFIVQYTLITQGEPSLEKYFGDNGGILHFFNQHILIIIGVQLLIGILIGVLSSLFAIRKYLKIETVN